MKARLLPLYFEGRDIEFDQQLAILKEQLTNYAEFLPDQPLGSSLPEAEAIIFPQLLGEAYRRVEEIKKIDLPLLTVTSEFGTVLMWDWEIASYLRAEGLNIVAPYSLEHTKKACQAECRDGGSDLHVRNQLFSIEVRCPGRRSGNSEAAMVVTLGGEYQT